MRRLLLALAGAAALAAGSGAQAQFANHSIGLTAGYMPYCCVGVRPGLDGGVNFGIDYSLYFENGFDLYARTLVGIYVEAVSREISIPLGGGIGLRYLFLEEKFQPYAGLQLNGAWITFKVPDIGGGYFGIAPYAGVQYFISSDWSIGLTAEFQLNFVPGGTFPLFGAFGILARAAVHF